VLLGSLGVVPSDSRPQVSDDNPFYEAQLKTLKYRPDFPARFGAYEDAERSASASSPGTTSSIGTAPSAS
jgi:putative transposase